MRCSRCARSGCILKVFGHLNWSPARNSISSNCSILHLSFVSLTNLFSMKSLEVRELRLLEVSLCSLLMIMARGASDYFSSRLRRGHTTWPLLMHKSHMPRRRPLFRFLNAHSQIGNLDFAIAGADDTLGFHFTVQNVVIAHLCKTKSSLVQGLSL